MGANYLTFCLTLLLALASVCAGRALIGQSPMTSRETIACMRDHGRCTFLGLSAAKTIERIIRPRGSWGGLRHRSYQSIQPRITVRPSPAVHFSESGDRLSSVLNCKKRELPCHCPSSATWGDRNLKNIKAHNFYRWIPRKNSRRKKYKKYQIPTTTIDLRSKRKTFSASRVLEPWLCWIQ